METIELEAQQAEAIRQASTAELVDVAEYFTKLADWAGLTGSRNLTREYRTKASWYSAELKRRGETL